MENVTAAVLSFGSLAAFAAYLEGKELALRVINANGSYKVVGAYNRKNELIAKVSGYGGGK